MHSVYNLFHLIFFFFTPQNVPMEEAGSSPPPEGRETEGDVEAGLLDVDLDGYQTTLEEVLTWLLSAEDTLQDQDVVSDDVEEVKEQFHTHEVGRRKDRVDTEIHRFVFLTQNKVAPHSKSTLGRLSHLLQIKAHATVLARCMLGMLSS